MLPHCIFVCACTSLELQYNQIMQQIFFFSPVVVYPLECFQPYFVDTSFTGEKNVITPSTSPLEKNKIQNAYEKQLKKRKYSHEKKYWTSEEDFLLLKLINQGISTEEISKQIMDTNEDMCLRRFLRLKKTRETWSPDEDQIIKDCYENKQCSWKEIGAILKKHSTKQIRERYCNFLKSGIVFGPWTIEQDLRLLNLVKQQGRNWRLFESMFPHRSECQIKNRYFRSLSSIAKKVEKKMRRIFARSIKDSPQS